MSVEDGDPNNSDDPRLSDTGSACEVIVSAEWLAEHLSDPNLVVLEVTHEREPAPWSAGHLPGSRSVAWRALLWDAARREFAEPAVLGERLGSLGITRTSEIIICADRAQFGTYTYWVLKMMGHARVRVLDGGKSYWLRHGFPITTEPPMFAATDDIWLSPDEGSRVRRDEVLGAVRTADSALVDLRSVEEYTGLRVSGPATAFDHGAEARGRIPGAAHLYYETLLGDDGRFLPPAKLKERFRAAGVLFDRPVITYCRLGHRASMGWFCLSEILGFRPVRVYDGSWTEWGSMVGMPVER